MSEPIKIAIVMDGGCLQAVLSAGVPVEYVVVEYDTDPADKLELVDVLQSDGTTEKAHVNAGPLAEVDGPFVLRCFDLAADDRDPAHEGPPPEREWVTNPSAGQTQRYEVSGHVALDIECEATTEQEAKEAWSATLANTASDLGFAELHSGHRIMRAFYTHPGEDCLMVEPAFDPDAPENQPPDDGLPKLPFGSVWRENKYGLAVTEANLILLANGRVMDCTDAAECLNWSKRGDPADITHWTRVRDPENHVRGEAA